MSDEALLRDRDDARIELARVTFERDEAREQRDAAIDREVKALLEVEELGRRVGQLDAALLVVDRRRGTPP